MENEERGQEYDIEEEGEWEGDGDGDVEEELDGEGEGEEEVDGEWVGGEGEEEEGEGEAIVMSEEWAMRFFETAERRKRRRIERERKEYVDTIEGKLEFFH